MSCEIYVCVRRGEWYDAKYDDDEDGDDGRETRKTTDHSSSESYGTERLLASACGGTKIHMPKGNRETSI